jgi:hypothetical protein
MNFEKWNRRPEKMVTEGLDANGNRKVRMMYPTDDVMKQDHIDDAVRGHTTFLDAYGHPLKLYEIREYRAKRVHTMVEIPDSVEFKVEPGLFIALDRLRGARANTPDSSKWEFHNPTQRRNEGVVITWDTPTRKGRLYLRGLELWEMRTHGKG